MSGWKSELAEPVSYADVEQRRRETVRWEVRPALIFEVGAGVDLVADAVVEPTTETKQEIRSRCTAAHDLIRARGRGMAKSDKGLGIRSELPVVLRPAQPG